MRGRRKHMWQSISWAGVFLAASLSACMAAELPQVKAFSPEITETLARQMYVQDQEAAKATDALFAAHPQDDLVKQGLAGWIVVPGKDGDIVRFLRKDGAQLARFYDIRFSAAGEPVLSEPSEKAVSDSERAQFLARRLASETTGRGCNGHNTSIAMQNPDGSGWLVWVIPANTDAHKVILGGDVRYRISGDGKNILHADKFSENCNVERNPEASVKNDGGILMTYPSGIYPSETQAFFTLSRHLPLFESTPNGRVWEIRDGHISRVLPDDPGMNGVISRALLGTDEYCLSIMQTQKDGQPVYVAGKDPVRVTELLEYNNKLNLKILPGYTSAAVACNRTDIVPLPNDYKIFASSAYLRIDDIGVGHEKRSGMFGISNSRIVFKLMEGPALTPDQNARMQARLAKMQAALDAAEK